MKSFLLVSALFSQSVKGLVTKFSKVHDPAGLKDSSEKDSWMDTEQISAEEREYMQEFQNLPPAVIWSDSICLKELPSSVNCSRTKPSGNCDYSDLKGAWKGNEWIPAENTCPKLARKDFQSRHIKKRNYYFMGNSVTRGYASALSKLMHGQFNPPMNHKTEKKACQENSANKGIGSESCDYGSGQVHFRWKIGISTYGKVKDDRGDACKAHEPDIPACLSKQFQGATADDVLFISSHTINQTYMNQIHPPRKMGLGDGGEVFLKTAIQNDNAAVVKMLLNAFPGRIFYMSPGALKMKLDTHHVQWDVNSCYRRMAKIAQCAVEAVHDSRVAFVDLFPVQSSNYGLYADMIHHPGLLSEEVLTILMGMV